MKPFQKKLFIDDETLPRTFNVVLIGDEGCGKTCLIRGAQDDMLPTPPIVDYSKTEPDRHVIKLNTNRGIVTFNALELVDADCKHVRVLRNTSKYPKGNQIDLVLLVWDVNSGRGLRKLTMHRRFLENLTGRKDFLYILVGTKAGVTTRRKTSLFRLQQYIQKWKLPYLQTDAGSSMDCEQPFLFAARYFMRQSVVKDLMKFKKMTRSRALEAMPRFDLRMLAYTKVPWPSIVDPRVQSYRKYRQAGWFRKGRYHYPPDYGDLDHRYPEHYKYVWKVEETTSSSEGED